MLCVVGPCAEGSLYNSAPVASAPACLRWIRACIPRTPHDPRGQGLCEISFLHSAPGMFAGHPFPGAYGALVSPLMLLLVCCRDSSGGGAARAGLPALLPLPGFVFGADRLRPYGLTRFHGNGLPQHHSYWPPTASPEGWAIIWPVPSWWHLALKKI